MEHLIYENGFSISHLATPRAAERQARSLFLSLLHTHRHRLITRFYMFRGTYRSHAQCFAPTLGYVQPLVVLVRIVRRCRKTSFQRHWFNPCELIKLIHQSHRLTRCDMCACVCGCVSNLRQTMTSTMKRRRLASTQWNVAQFTLRIEHTIFVLIVVQIVMQTAMWWGEREQPLPPPSAESG